MTGAHGVRWRAVGSILRGRRDRPWQPAPPPFDQPAKGGRSAGCLFVTPRAAELQLRSRRRACAH
jgi:hypothetical protein